MLTITIEELTNANCEQMTALLACIRSGLAVRVFGDDGATDHRYPETLVAQWDCQPA